MFFFLQKQLFGDTDLKKLRFKIGLELLDVITLGSSSNDYIF